jgi:stress response protein SCP2
MEQQPQASFPYLPPPSALLAPLVSSAAPAAASAFPRLTNTGLVISPSEYSSVVFGLAWDPGSDNNKIDLDIQAVAVDCYGCIVDVAYYNNLKALGKGMIHSGDEREGLFECSDEQVTIFLTKLPVDIEAIFIVVCSFTGKSFHELVGGDDRNKMTISLDNNHEHQQQLVHVLPLKKNNDDVSDYHYQQNLVIVGNGNNSNTCCLAAVLHRIKGNDSGGRGGGGGLFFTRPIEKVIMMMMTTVVFSLSFFSFLSAEHLWIFEILYLFMRFVL